MNNLIRQTVTAPEGSVFRRAAYDRALGCQIPLRIDGAEIGQATLLGAIPNDPESRRASIELTWEVDELIAPFFYELQSNGTLTLDPYLPRNPFNPAAAIAIVRGETL